MLKNKNIVNLYGSSRYSAEFSVFAHTYGETVPNLKIPKEMQFSANNTIFLKFALTVALKTSLQ